MAIAKRITALDPLTASVVPEDLIHVVDVSDTTADPAGSSYKSQFGTFLRTYNRSAGERAENLFNDDLDFLYLHGCVLRYGAVIDNSGGSTTDSLAAFDIAQRVAGQTGNPGSIGIACHIPAGKYTLSGEWVVDKARRITGDGKYLSLLKFLTGSTNGITITKNDCELDNLGLVNSYGNGIKIDRVNRCSLTDILVSPYTNGYGYWNHGGFIVTLERYRMTTNGQQPFIRQGDPTWPNEDDVLSNTNVNQHGIFADPDPVSLDGTSASIYRDCHVAGVYGSGFYSIGTAAAGAAARSYGLISGCDFEGNGAVTLKPQLHLERVSHMVINGTHTEGASSHLKIDDCNRCIITDFANRLEMVGTISGNDAFCTDNIFIGGQLDDLSTIAAEVQRTKFYNTVVEDQVINLSRTTEFWGCPQERGTKALQEVKGTSSGSTGPVVNDNVNFSRWLTVTQPEGYTALSAAFSQVIHATDGFHGTIACRVTTLGSVAREGIQVVIPKEITAREEYLAVSFQLRKTSALDGEEFELRSIGGNSAVIVLPAPEDLPDDVWIPFSFAVGNLENDADDITISLDLRNSPAVGKFFDVDAFSVSRGEGSYTHGAPNANEMRDLYLNDVRVTNAASIPVSGSYVQGDFVGNTALSINGDNMILLGWSRLVTGSAHVANTDWGLCYVSSVTPAT